jgi:hypothetical protein
MNYDLSGYHPLCTGKSIVSVGGALMIYCPVCQVLANVEAVSGKISAEEACKSGKDQIRIVTGDMSPNIVKGEVVK